MARVEPGIAWEGAIDSAMQAACDEILRLREKLAALDHLGRGADDCALANLAALYLAQMVVRLEAMSGRSVPAPWGAK